MKGVKELHAHLITSNRHRDSHSVSQVIRAYALSQPNIGKARSAFDQVDRPSLLLFNHLIRGLSQSDQPSEAIRLYHRMIGQASIFGDNSTFIFVLKACSRVPDVSVGRGVHVRAAKLGFERYLYVSNALVHFYGCCGVLSLARKVFDEMPHRDLVSWNSLICGYTKWNMFKEVLVLFEAMQESGARPDSVTLMKVILACSYLREHEKADLLVKYVESNRIAVNVYLGNTMIDMYARRGLVNLARGVFNEMRERNVVSWNAMMMGYVNSGDLSGARSIFDEMPKRDVVSWTSMITAYSQAHRHSEAVKLFQEMMACKVRPDKVTLASALSACAHLGSLEIGEAIHDFVTNHQGVKPDICVGNALIDMYFKCGSAERALRVFGEMKEKDDVTWTSAISGSAVNGFASSAIELFSRMLREGTKPSHGSFVGILLACAHTGLVEKGLSYFESMEKVYGLKPEMKHYGCVVDMLGRSGNLDKAIEFINNMPVKPNAVVWRALLSACKLYGDVGLAEFVTNKLLEFEACNSGDFVLSSNAYAGMNRWNDSAEIRDRMHGSDVQRPLGFSFTEIKYADSNLVIESDKAAPD